MGARSRQKGKRGEREAAALVRDAWGIAARRGRQYAGHPDAPDVTADIPGVHLEVKRRERCRPGEWLEQALADAGDELPVVLHRRTRQPWLLTLHAEHAVSFATRLLAAVRTAAQAREVCSGGNEDAKG